MQTIVVLSQVTDRGYLLPTDPAPVADAYRAHCQRKGLPVVSISPSGKLWEVRLDMTTTGRTLNAVGQQVLQQMAWRLGSILPVADGLRSYSLPTAEKVARRLASIGKDKRFWTR